MAQQQDIISEARANLTRIDSEIEAAREQIHSLQEKVENLQRQKAQDEALIRIVDMHAQGKDLSLLLNPKNVARNSTQRVRDPNEPRTVREGTRAPRGNTQAILDVAKELLGEHETANVRDIFAAIQEKRIAITGKNEGDQLRNVRNMLAREGSGIKNERGVFSLA